MNRVERITKRYKETQGNGDRRQWDMGKIMMHRKDIQGWERMKGRAEGTERKERKEMEQIRDKG